MEIIIAIVIVVAFVAVWYNRRAPAAPVVEAETFSDNGIKFAAKEETPAPVAAPAAPAPVAAEPAPKKPRAKKPAVVAKTANVAKKTAAKKPATAKATTKKPAKTAKAK